MKTKKFKSKQLLKLHLLKSRIFEYSIKKTNFNYLNPADLDQILVGVRKALQIIFQYDLSNKRILFIGLPTKLEFKINSLTQHVAVSNIFDIQSIVSNNATNSLVDLKNSTSKFAKRNPKVLLPKLIKKPDLVILFDHKKSSAILSDSWTAKIPAISFVSIDNFRNSTVQNSYFVNGNFKNILTAFDKNIFFIGLNFLFRNLKKKKAKSFSILPNSGLQVSNKRVKKPKLRN